MVDVVFIAGCERSGTNYMQWLLKENFKNIIAISTEKHYEPRGIIEKLKWDNEEQENLNSVLKEIDAFADETAIIRRRGLPKLAFVGKEFQEPRVGKRSEGIYTHVRQAMTNGTMKFLVNIKNPYGWHISYTKHWPHQKFAQHMKHWTDLYEGWQIFEGKFSTNTMFIKHEDALKDFQSELLKIKDKFDLTNRVEPYIAPQKRLSTTTDEIGKTKFQDKEYFEKELYKPDLLLNKKKELDECREIISKQLCNRFNYEIL